MAGEFEHIRGKGNRFTSDNQPPNRGRKPKLYTKLKDAYGLSYEEYKQGKRYCMQRSKAQLEELAKADDTPIWLVIIARSYLKAAAKGEMDALEQTKADLWGKDIAAAKEDIGADTQQAYTIRVIGSKEELTDGDTDD